MFSNGLQTDIPTLLEVLHVCTSLPAIMLETVVFNCVSDDSQFWNVVIDKDRIREFTSCHAHAHEFVEATKTYIPNLEAQKKDTSKKAQNENDDYWVRKGSSGTSGAL